mmetsp:Transcript_37529/g.123835  ORF Transcript_37529/g.123835 Transcript_37529/m.123835 type:complete len:618 (-) Transcript_37529:848-2701(-)
MRQCLPLGVPEHGVGWHEVNAESAARPSARIPIRPVPQTAIVDATTAHPHADRHEAELGGGVKALPPRRAVQEREPVLVEELLGRPDAAVLPLVRARHVLQRADVVVHVVEREPDGDHVGGHKVEVGRIAVESERRRAGRLGPHLVVGHPRPRPPAESRDGSAERRRAHDVPECSVRLVDVDQLEGGLRGPAEGRRLLARLAPCLRLEAGHLVGRPPQIKLAAQHELEPLVEQGAHLRAQQPIEDDEAVALKSGALTRVNPGRAHRVGGRRRDGSRAAVDASGPRGQRRHGRRIADGEKEHTLRLLRRTMPSVDRPALERSQRGEQRLQRRVGRLRDYGPRHSVQVDGSPLSVRQEEDAAVAEEPDDRGAEQPRRSLARGEVGAKEQPLRSRRAERCGIARRRRLAPRQRRHLATRRQAVAHHVGAEGLEDGRVVVGEHDPRRAAPRRHEPAHARPRAELDDRAEGAGDRRPARRLEVVAQQIRRLLPDLTHARRVLGRVLARRRRRRAPALLGQRRRHREEQVQPALQHPPPASRAGTRLSRRRSGRAGGPGIRLAALQLRPHLVAPRLERPAQLGVGLARREVPGDLEQRAARDGRQLDAALAEADVGWEEGEAV